MRLSKLQSAVSVVVALVTTRAAAQANHLLLSEVGVETYLEAEGASSNYIEIYNPTNVAVPLDNYYLADTNLYTSVTLTTNLDTGATDNIIRFPASASIASGQHIVITGSGTSFMEEFFNDDTAAFTALPGSPLIFETTETSASIPNMISLNTGGANETQRTHLDLNNGHEFVIFFNWDGVSPVVKDVDLLAWGGGAQTSNSYAAKKPTTPAGPGGSYSTDGGPNSTLPIGAGYRMGERLTPVEQSEVQIGGNGITGHDETTESPNQSWRPLDYYQANPGVGSLYTDAQSKPPLFISVGLNNSSPTSTTVLSIDAKVTDHDGLGTIASVTAFVDTGNGFAANPAVNLTGGNYTVDLGTFPDGTIVRYYLEALDNTGAIARYPIYGAFDPKYIFINDRHVNPTHLVVNEILYDTVGPDDAYEFVEIYNPQDVSFKLPYFTFSGGTLSPVRFPADIEIEAYGFVLITKDSDALLARYTIPPDVPIIEWGYSSLNNSINPILLSSINDVVMLNFSYSRSAPWPNPNVTTTDQTIELKNPSLNYRSGTNWGLSNNAGTPGLPNSILNSSVGHWMLY